MLKLHLFGAPQAWVEGREVAHFPTSKSLALLSYLTLEQQESHARTILCGLLWPDSPERRARQNLSQELSRLRRTLGSAAQLLQATQRSVGLNQSHIECDVNQFGRLIASTERHPHASLVQCRVCITALEQAIELARGELLSGIELRDAYPFEEWLLFERERQREMLLGALYQAAQAALAGASYSAAISRAQQQIALEPWRESAHRQLIEALVLSGRRSEALAQFELCRRLLADELGVEPSSVTRQLAAQIREGRYGAAPPVAATPVARATTHNLPANLLPTIGREAEIDAISADLQDEETRIVTLVGQGGAGKTRLSLEVGRRLAAGTCFSAITFVPLAGVDDVNGVAPAIAHALQLEAHNYESSETLIMRHLRSSRNLLILDNFEQLLAATDWLVKLLQQLPQLQLLVTSRTRLGLLSEDLFKVGGLPFPPPDAPFEQARDFAAPRLFLDRARRQSKRFRADPGNWPHIINICRMLEGLPLGIELATVWITDLGVETIAANMAGDLDFLTTDLRDFARHQRSLRHVFEQSWARLDAAEQQALAALSLMRGSFTSAAAKSVAQTTGLILRRLRDRSLLRASGVGRLNMHEVVRQFAAEKLSARPSERTVAAQRHAAYYLQIDDIVSRAQAHERISIDRAVQENLDNLLAAWRWAVDSRAAEQLARLLEGIHAIGRTTFFSREPRIWLRQLRAISRLFSDPSATRQERDTGARALLFEVALLIDISRYDEAAALLEGASVVDRDSADDELATFYFHRGRVILHRGDSDGALALFERGLDAARQTSDHLLEADILRQAGSAYRQRGDYLPYIARVEEALAIYQTHSYKAGEQAMLYWLGTVYGEIGSYWRGRVYLQAAEALNPVTESPYHLASIATSLARVEQLLGQPARAVVMHRQVIPKLIEINEVWRRICLHIDLSAAESATGLHEDALRSAEQALELASARALVELEGQAQQARGYALLHAGQFDEAAGAFAASASLLRPIGRTVGVVEARICTAWIALCVDNAKSAEPVDDALAYICDHQAVPFFQYEHLYRLAFEVALQTDRMRAAAVLQTAQTFVRNVLDPIGEPQYRQSYAARPAVRHLLTL